MLLLTSNGLSSPALLEKTSALTGGGKAYIVTTASVGYKEKDRHIPRLTEELHALGLSVSLFDFDVQAPEGLLDASVVEINGGNPFYLLSSMRKAACGPVLRQIAEKGLLIGLSAGSMVLQRDIALVASYSPEMNEGVGLTDLRGFHLTEAEILPHYTKFLHRFDRFEERAAEYERRTGRTVIRLNDGQALLADGDRLELI